MKNNKPIKDAQRSFYVFNLKYIRIKLVTEIYELFIGKIRIINKPR